MKKTFISITPICFCLKSTRSRQYQGTQRNLNMRSQANTSTSEVILVIPQGNICYYRRRLRLQVDSCHLQRTNRVRLYQIPQQRETSIKVPYSSPIKYYTNSSGERVQSPTHYNSPPSGATALCRDGTYSFSRSRRGTCSHHGGVARWL